MSFNPDKETGTKINYRDIAKVKAKEFTSKYIKHEWIDKFKYVSKEVETEIEPALAAHEMIERLMNPVSDTINTFYGVNTRMLSLNQRNEFIKNEAEKLQEKATEYVEEKKKEYEEAKKAAEEAAKQAQVPEPTTEQKGE